MSSNPVYEKARRIYNRALKATRIPQMYPLGNPGELMGLLGSSRAWWKVGKDDNTLHRYFILRIRKQSSGSSLKSL